MEYTFIILLILSALSLIYFSWKAISTRRPKYIWGLLISAIPLLSTAIFLWIIFSPYRQIHANDKDYFGEYELSQVEGHTKNVNFGKLKLRLSLHKDFTYNLTSFDEKEYPSSGKWKTCWTDICQFGFNYDNTNRFFAIDVTDDSVKYLKLHKVATSDQYYLVFKKLK
ncbi:MAG: hypothetical protein U0V75_17900 [Ferruginibacter sp.]